MKVLAYHLAHVVLVLLACLCWYGGTSPDYGTHPFLSWASVRGLIGWVFLEYAVNLRKRA